MPVTASVGQDLTIVLGRATGHRASGITVLHGRVTAETDGAVEITSAHGACWFPRRALRPRGCAGTYEIAGWYDPKPYAAAWLCRNASVALVAA